MMRHNRDAKALEDRISLRRTEFVEEERVWVSKLDNLKQENAKFVKQSDAEHEARLQHQKMELAEEERKFRLKLDKLKEESDELVKQHEQRVKQRMELEEKEKKEIYRQLQEDANILAERIRVRQSEFAAEEGEWIVKLVQAKQQVSLTEQSASSMEDLLRKMNDLSEGLQRINLSKT
jgi:hypothetical protein